MNGIGEKTGIYLLTTYGDLDSIYDHLDDLTPGVKKKFLNDKENAYMCKSLATIRKDCLQNKTIDNFKFEPINSKSLINLFNKYQINGLERWLEAYMQPKLDD